jgi:hypothetical protein
MFQTATPIDTPHGKRVLLSGARGPLLAAFVNGFLTNLPNVAHSSSYVIDANGRIVGGTNVMPGAPIPDRALAAAVARGHQGDYGDDRFFTSAPIRGTPWSIVLSANKDDLYSSVNGAQEVVPWVLFGAFVLAVLLGLFLLRRVFQQNNRLQRAELNREHALEINDNIVQRLVVAKYELERGSDQASRAKVAETLQEAQQLVTSMLEDKPIRGGVLRRGAPAVTDRPPEPAVSTPEPEDVK